MANVPNVMLPEAYAIPSTSGTHVFSDPLAQNPTQNRELHITQFSQPHTNPQPWNKVESKKRYRNSPEAISNKLKRQAMLPDYWLNKPAETKNSFDALEEEEDKDSGTTGKLKPIKSPPIFVCGVNYIRPLQELLDMTAKNEYTMKVLNNNQVKIQPNSSEKYLPIIEALKEKKTEFYTYQRKQDKTFKVILRNMHPTSDQRQIIEALAAKNHNVSRISNIQQQSTKIPLPLFLVELEPNDNNKDIYKIREINNSIITFEPPYKKRDIPQCRRCQQHGHTSKYCYKSPKCTKCAEGHWTSDCLIKEKTDNVKCYNCGGNHPASYKGCNVRKQLQKKLFPALREKRNIQQPNAFSAGQVQPNIMYSQIVQGTAQQTSSNHQPQQQQTTAATIAQQPINNKLEEMMSQLMGRMDTMLNLLTALIAKIA